MSQLMPERCRLPYPCIPSACGIIAPASIVRGWFIVRGRQGGHSYREQQGPLNWYKQPSLPVMSHVRPPERWGRQSVTSDDERGRGSSVIPGILLTTWWAPWCAPWSLETRRGDRCAEDAAECRSRGIIVIIPCPHCRDLLSPPWCHHCHQCFHCDPSDHWCHVRATHKHLVTWCLMLILSSSHRWYHIMQLEPELYGWSQEGQVTKHIQCGHCGSGGRTRAANGRRVTRNVLGPPPPPRPLTLGTICLWRPGQGTNINIALASRSQVTQIIKRNNNIGYFIFAPALVIHHQFLGWSSCWLTDTGPHFLPSLVTRSSSEKMF